MRFIKQSLAFLLAIILILPIIFFSSVSAIGENIPTIFIDNEAWYKYRLLPLIMYEEEHCVPISVFSGFDFLGVSFNEIYGCYLITSETGEFLSVNTEKGRYLDHRGERGNITVLRGEKEYYISAVKAAEVLGLGIELTVFYDKDVVRLYSKEELQPLEILIDYYVASPDSIIGSASPGGAISRSDIFSAVADISDVKTDVINTLLDLADSINVTMTFAVNAEFVSNNKNLPILLKIAASGHTFAISIDPESDIDPLSQAEKCNDLLYQLFKQKTLLVLGSNDKSRLSEKGYTVLSNMQKISEISSIESLNLKRVRLIFFDSTNMMNQSKFIAIARAVSDAGKKVAALNPLTGK